MNILDTSIEYLKGVGPKRAEILQQELGIYRFYDLLSHFPYRYIDRTRFHLIRELRPDTGFVQLKGIVTHVEIIEGKGRKARMVATLSDGSGNIQLVWFSGIKWIRTQVKPQQKYVVFGKLNVFNNKLSIAHPEMDLLEGENPVLPSGLQPLYNSTEKAKSAGLDSKGLSRLIKTLLDQHKQPFKETLPEYLVQKLRLPDRNEALRQIHQPESMDKMLRAKFRLKFEELFFVQLRLLRMMGNRKAHSPGFVFEKIDHFFHRFYHEFLPFELTNAQKRVIKEIRKDVLSGVQMNRLLQGDVGSGKTMVALITMLMALDNNYQACMLAPTEILATQHFKNLYELIEPLGINIRLLTGSTKKKERDEIHAMLQDGSLQILVGTHAILEEKVIFKNLGLAIIDEQHRFGVAQRARLWQKNAISPHILVMTATPIPRTLAMTLYGDLDVSVIDELPPGRKPIKTIHRYELNRQKVYDLVDAEIKKGRQAYFVYPLIDESEKLDYKNLMDGFEQVKSAFPNYHVSILHGKMTPEAKEFEMNRFVKGETQIMVSTTVIEVGVNVPNASVMVIESAERFGLSQLHQLRGRVGRGAEQSYCILITPYKISEEGRKRMETMVRTNDGFEIAEVDLQLRGPGDIEGTRQSGLMNFKIADIVKDQKIVALSRDAARTILEEDPELRADKHQILIKTLEELNQGKTNWSKIS
jgi:ATP-dependent DNA helicase RecG